MALNGPVSPEPANRLQQAVADAYASLQMAKLNYERAVAVGRGVDDPPIPDRVVAIRRVGLEYAGAVTRYSNAVMTWLAYVDTAIAPTKKPVGKTTTSE